MGEDYVVIWGWAAVRVYLGRNDSGELEWASDLAGASKMPRAVAEMAAREHRAKAVALAEVRA